MSQQPSFTLTDSQKQCRELVEFFDALSTEIRLKLFLMLSVTPTPLSVGELAKIVGIKDSLASQNLRILEKAGLLTGFSGGVFKIYVPSEQVVGKIEEFLKYIVSTIKVNEEKRKEQK